MSIDTVTAYLSEFHLDSRVMTFLESSATVELAAVAVGCRPAQIAKTLSFRANGNAMLIVAAGDAKIDNASTRRNSTRKRPCYPTTR